MESWRADMPGHPNIQYVSRAYFDQDRGAEFLRRVSAQHIDSEVLARYTVLGAAFCILKFIENQNSFTFPRGSVQLNFIDSNVGEFMTIDRRTILSLEIISNARSGDQHNSLFGKIDRTHVWIILPCLTTSSSIINLSHLTKDGWRGSIPSAAAPPTQREHPYHSGAPGARANIKKFDLTLPQSHALHV